MVCNDLTIANQMLSDWHESCPPEREFRRVGASAYFVRMQIAHFSEGFKVLEAIRKTPYLESLVRWCNQHTQDAFDLLQHGSVRGKVESIATRIRNKATFHYFDNADGKALIDWAIADRATRQDARSSTVTRGSHCYLWYFKPADDVIDSIVVRKILNVPRTAVTRKAVDEATAEINEYTMKFLDFAGELIWRYVGQ